MEESWVHGGCGSLDLVYFSDLAMDDGFLEEGSFLMEQLASMLPDGESENENESVEFRGPLSFLGRVESI